MNTLLSEVEVQRRLESMRRQMHLTIEREGWFVQAATGPESRPGLYACTVGMLRHFGFELIVFGWRREMAAATFRELGGLIRRGITIQPDVVYRSSTHVWWINEYPLLLKACDPVPQLYDELLVAARQYWRRADFPVLQLVLADPGGKLPHEPGYDTQYMASRQPLLFATGAPQASAF